MKPTADELLAAIRAHCMECSGGSRKEVERCNVKSCKLRPYRSVKALGHIASPGKLIADRQIGMFDTMEVDRRC